MRGAHRPAVCTGVMDSVEALGSVSNRFQLTCSSVPTACRTQWDKGTGHLPGLHWYLSSPHYLFHSGCCHDVLSALLGRVGMQTPDVKRDSIRNITQTFKNLGRSIGATTPISMQQVVDLYEGPKRARYARAMQKINMLGHKVCNPKVKMFVKQEVLVAKRSKPNPACRAIQYRSYEYSLYLATFLKPIEHKLYKARNIKGFGKLPFMAKNMNSRQRAKLIVDKFNLIRGCAILELDAHRFDAHCSKDILQLEHSVYTMANNDPAFKKLLRAQLVNKGASMNKDNPAKYKVIGTRMSGDMNTSGGNCVIMSCLLSYFGSVHFNHPYELLVDGDDSLLFVDPRDHVPTAEEILEFFLPLGFRIGVDGVRDRLEDIRFCKGAVVKLNGEYTMVRDILQAVGKTLVSPKYLDRNLSPKLLKTRALGELSLLVGCPIMDVFYRRLIQIADEQMSRKGRKDGGVLKASVLGYRFIDEFERVPIKIRTAPITDENRAEVSKVFGISPERQVVLEGQLNGLQFNLSAPFCRNINIYCETWNLIESFPERLGYLYYSA